MSKKRNMQFSTTVIKYNAQHRLQRKITTRTYEHTCVKDVITWQVNVHARKHYNHNVKTKLLCQKRSNHNETSHDRTATHADAANQSVNACHNRCMKHIMTLNTLINTLNKTCVQATIISLPIMIKQLERTARSQSIHRYMPHTHTCECGLRRKTMQLKTPNDTCVHGITLVWLEHAFKLTHQLHASKTNHTRDK